MMSAKVTEKLIQCIRKHPSLYDPSSSYKKLSLRTKRKMWDNIGSEINVTGEVARMKWRSLRDNYIRYRKEILTAQPEKKFAKWHWAPHLKFLDNILDVRKRPSNNSRTSETPPPEINIPQQINNPTVSQMEANSDIDKIINFLQNKKKSDCNAIDNLFRSYAQTFKTFSAKNQIMLKLEIAKLFSDVELKEMEETGFK